MLCFVFLYGIRFTDRILSMLTRNDLDQIRGIIKEEVKDEVSVQLKPINRKLNRIQKEITYLEKITAMQ